MALVAWTRTEHSCHATGLHRIADWRRCRVGVHMVDVVWRQPRVVECRLHGTGRAPAVLSWRCDVVPLGRLPVAPHLSVDRGSTPARVLQLLQHQAPRALTQHEATPALIKRP